MKKARTRKEKSIINIIAFCFMFVFAMSVGVNFYNQSHSLKQLRSEETTLATALANAEQENIQLKNKQDYYTSDAYIEKVAREQLGLVKADEIVFKNKE